jgi:halimadienyl-diphosphate synthase
MVGSWRGLDRGRPVARAGGNARLSTYLDDAVDSILRRETSRSIQPTDYDTCWVARLVDPDGTLAYPDLLRELLERQHPDGSWGGRIPYVHDRFLTTLAIVLLLARFGNR